MEFKVGDKVVVARHKRCGNSYIFDEMINTEGIIINISNDRATVEFGCLEPNGEQGTISFSFNINQLDLISE